MPRPQRSRAAALKSRQLAKRGAEAVAGLGADEVAGGSSDDSYDDASHGSVESSDGSHSDAVAGPSPAGRGGRVRQRDRRGRGAEGAEGASESGPTRSEPAAAAAQAPAPPDVYKIAAYPQDSRRTRLYAGPLKKWDRYRSLIEILYGPDPEAIGIVDSLRHHWIGYPVLPRKTSYQDSGEGETGDDDDGDDDDGDGQPRNSLGGMQPSPWVSDSFEADQAAAFHSWYAEPDNQQQQQQQQQQTIALSAETAQQYLSLAAAGELIAFLGPTSRQQVVQFRPGSCVALQESGYPDGGGEGGDGGETDGKTAGWMLDAGGIVVATAWAPLTGRVDQLLAVAAVPHGDQEPAGSGLSATVPDSGNQQKQGSIQLWRVALDAASAKMSRRRPRDPVLERVLLFEWGRPKRMQWCPVALGTSATCGLLAVLTGDGMVRVVEVKRGSGGGEGGSEAAYDWISHPIATLGLPDEYNVAATCLTWLGLNRLVLGHTDGSLSLWSVRPRLLLQRLPVHATHVLDVCSGYPSYPYMVASHPVGGLARLVDLTRPSSEHTFHPSPMVTFQPGLLQWCDHMLGFAAAAPSNNPRNGRLDFLHVRFYPGSRTFFPGRGLAPPICLAVGTSHPFALVGRADGSLWACNVMQKVFRNRADLSYRLKIVDVEFRPPASEYRHPSVRGAVRILHGFEPERNEQPAAQPIASSSSNAPKDYASSNNDSDGGPPSNDAGSDAEQESGQAVIHDPLTRISAVAWNPNIEYGWWAAVGMACGLVRIVDLGVD
ncbi:transcription factor tfiiic complex subunit [Grosmannia clavigera kw1407]|uniref:Transcription factor tfiiic complex subunit n=1 Tax=Grosmannia clavigera (strain kw1407 / UAMH 11150) TaxID=655863 RepID=F0XPE3_GROCL|nr:transcription factor tfiiic complex subunit [Grosmannia clavigera kw1407]EFX00524.1 transcription factor tfiiic complex subunit [Grosmannia clavigera kw1407]